MEKKVHTQPLNEGHTRGNIKGSEKGTFGSEKPKGSPTDKANTAPPPQAPPPPQNSGK
jgi:hypothetical protein